MSAAIDRLRRCEKKLLEALATTDLLKFSKDLQSYRVITSEMRKSISSLDHKRLDPRTRARYLLNLVYKRMEVDDAVCIKFLSVLSEIGNDRLAKIGRALVQLHLAEDIPSAVAGISSPCLAEQDVGYLVDILAEVSYKWEEISIALRLPINSIEECRNVSTNRLRLHKALTGWLHECYKHDRPAVMTHLREALASNTVQQWKLAGEIEERMKAKISSTVSPSMVDVLPPVGHLQIQYESTDITVRDGRSALLEVQVYHMESVTYQWMKHGEPLSDNSDFSGTKSDLLLISQARQGMEGEYCCHINHINKHLSINEHLKSSPVTLTIKYHKGKKVLLDKYAQLRDIPQNTWPLVSTDVYIELSLIKAVRVKNDDSNFLVEEGIEDILERRERIYFEDAFGKYEKGALVLVEGRPGSGKTTLAQKIAKDWSSGIVLRNGQMVFLLSLRKDRKKSDIFKGFFQSQSKPMRRKLEKCSGNGVCFILDGYDEYNPKYGDRSFVNQLLEKDYLPDAMIIITSRPIATAELRPNAVRTIEVLGFTKKQFNMFVNNFPFESSQDCEDADIAKSKLMTYLKSCTNVLNMCYLPINACIICFLYSQNQGDTLPKTETEIYENLVIAIILRKLRLKNRLAQLNSLKDLHGDNKKSFDQICSLAFNMTVEKKQVIRTLPTSLEPLNSSPFCDLFTVDCVAKLNGLVSVLTFLHLTLQEYLAAYYLASLNKDQQMEIIKLHNKEAHMMTTFKFLCGLIDMEQNMAHFFSITRKKPNALYMYHCVYETQNECVCYAVINALEGNISIGFGVLTPADFTVLGFVISTASFMIVRMDIQFCLLYEEFVDEKWKSRELDSTDPLSYSFETSASENFYNLKLCVEDLFCTHISYNHKPQYMRAKNKMNELFRNRQMTTFDESSSITAKLKTAIGCSSDIFKSDSSIPLSNALKKCTELRQLVLVGNHVSIRSASVIADILKNSIALEDVQLICIMPSSSAAVLVSGLRYSKQVHTLELVQIDLGLNGAMALAKALPHYNNLKILHLEVCSLGSESAEAIATGLKGKHLHMLSIAGNKIGSRGLLAVLKECHFRVLYTTHNKIGSVGTEGLARFLMKNPCLVNILNLSANNIDAKALVKGLSHCACLTCLTLSGNNLGPDGAAALSQGLRTCNSLKVLRLQYCNLGLGGMMALAEGLYSWRKLNTLQLSDNGIVPDGVAAVLAGGLQYLTVLQELYLSNNGIDTNGAIVLAEGLQYCCVLERLSLSRNSIGSAGAVALAGGLRCKGMHHVDLSQNNLDVDCAQELALLVQSNKLLKLDVSHNNIRSTGALCLVTELVHHFVPARLNLQANNISSKATQFLTTMRHRNTNLHVLM